MDAEVSLEDLASAETFLRRYYLDEDPLFEHASFFAHSDYFPRNGDCLLFVKVRYGVDLR